MKLFRDLVGALGVVIVVLALLGAGQSYGEDDYTQPANKCRERGGLTVCSNKSVCWDDTNSCVANCDKQRCDNQIQNCKCQSLARGCLCRE